MMNDNPTPLTNALYRVLRPLARLLLRNGVAYQSFAELVKRAYVEAALEDFQGQARKPSDSRTAVMTGLTRKEVKRQREALSAQGDGGAEAPSGNRAAKVVTGWVHDPDFLDVEGNPGVLPFEGAANSFSALVRRYSGDMTPRAVLDELVRFGLVSNDTGIRLEHRSFVPAGDDASLLAIFGEDVADLIRTVDHNLSHEQTERPLFQRTLSYTRVSARYLPEWRDYSARRCQALLEELDDWLARADADVSGETPEDGEPLHRAGLSIFQLEDPIASRTPEQGTGQRSWGSDTSGERQ